MGSIAHPLALALGPLAVLLLWLLERWRRRPPRLVVADPALFEPDAEVEAQARARRRRAGARWLLRAGAALLLALAAAGPRLPDGAGGALTVDLVLDRGLTADARDAAGRPRLDERRAALADVLARLREDDRVRLHLLPAGAAPAPPPVAPVTAGALLERAAPAGAPADLRAVLDAAAPDGPPVFVAADALPGPPSKPASGAGRARLASSAAPLSDVAVVSLREDEDGAVWVGLAARRDPQAPPLPARLRLRLRCSPANDGAPRELTREVALEGSEPLVKFEAAELAPAPTWIEAALEPIDASALPRDAPLDALPLDDRAAAVRELRPRRVGVVGDCGPWLRRALRAVPGVVLRELPRLDPAQVSDLDLVVAAELRPEAPLPGAPLLVVPRGLPADAAPGGVLEALAPDGLEQAFARSRAALASEPATLTRRGALPVLPRPRPLLRLRGGEPVAVVAGEGRRLVVALAFPLEPGTTTWTQLPSFPLFVAELLALVAPREGAQGSLVAQPVGAPWEGPAGPLVPLAPGLVRGPDGAPLVGTVCVLPDPVPLDLAAPRRFDAADLAALEAARPAARARPLGGWCLLAAALLALVAWRVDRSA